jgi:hypothetical protein
LGSIEKIALARFWRLDRSGASGSGVELVCGLTQFIGNWSLVIGHCLAILPITYYLLNQVATRKEPTRQIEAQQTDFCPLFSARSYPTRSSKS